jgi:hypothetical protein
MWLFLSNLENRRCKRPSATWRTRLCIARDGTGNADLDEVAVLYEHVMDGSVPAEEACQADVLLRIKELLRNKTESIKSSSRTAALWLQYMAMIDILRKFMRA